MEIVSKGVEPDYSFTADELILLNPTVNSIVRGFERLSASQQIDVIAIIVSVVLREHDVDNSFDLVEFLLGQRTQDQRQIAA